MTEALDAAPAGPQTDTLVEQAEPQRPVETPRRSLDETLRENVGKMVQGDEKPAEKPEKAEKVEEKPEAEEKPKPEDKPAKEEVKEKPEKARGDDGKFQKKEQEPVEAIEDKPEAPKKQTAFRDPPQRFDDAAKSEWEGVPESVRGAIHRSTREMEQGIERYKADAEAYETVRQFAEQAKQSGTDLKTALESYTGIEKMLRQNPIAGLEQVVENLGLTQKNGQPVTLKDVAQAYLARTPEQNQNNTLQARLAMMEQKERELLQREQQMQQEQYRQQLLQDAQKEFPRFEQLRLVMSGLLQTGQVSGANDKELMRAAYDAADKMFPATPAAAQTGTEPALAQTQTTPRQPNPAGKKSVSGAGGDYRPVRETSSDEAFRKAIARL